MPFLRTLILNRHVTFSCKARSFASTSLFWSGEKAQDGIICFGRNRKMNCIGMELHREYYSLHGLSHEYSQPVKTDELSSNVSHSTRKWNIKHFSSSKVQRQNRASQGLPKKLPLAGVKHVILVASGKGGVGKSSTSVNLALAMSQEPEVNNVGLLDADIYGPSIPMLMNLSGEPELNHQNLMIPLMNYGIKCMSMGFLVDEKSAIVWRGLMVMSAVQKLLREVAWGPLDYLVVDMPPGTGDVQLSISQNIPVSGSVVVTTPQDLALLDARRAIDMFSKVGIPALGIVENMSVFVCPNCGHQEHVFGKDGGKAIAAELGTGILGHVPLHPAIREGSDSGRPVLAAWPDTEFSQVYRTMAKTVIDKLKMAAPLSNS